MITAGLKGKTNSALYSHIFLLLHVNMMLLFHQFYCLSIYHLSYMIGLQKQNAKRQKGEKLVDMWNNCKGTLGITVTTVLQYK